MNWDLDILPLAVVDFEEEDERKVCANADNDNQFKPITNVDRIRSMRVEELAEFLANAYWSVCKEDVPVDPETEECMGSCKQCWLDWLKRKEET